MGNKKYKDTHRLQGKCVECSESILFPYNKCIEHLIAHRKRIKIKYYRYIEEGRCVTCGEKLHPDIDEGKRKCLNCREKLL